MRKLFIFGLATAYTCITAFSAQDLYAANNCHCECPPGPQGEQGAKGDRGKRGEQGKHGDRGDRGHRGHRGHRGPRGHHGDDGSRGERGRRGATGATGPAGPTFEINDVIEATQNDALNMALQQGQLVPFNAIVYPTTGLDVPGGMALVESIPGSGVFNAISLPIETADTLYEVTFGISFAPPPIEGSNPGDFQLVLNGVALPYTDIGQEDGFDHPLLLNSRTSVIVNPANTAGTLSIIALNSATLIAPPTDLSFSAYISVVKLNNNGS